MIYDLGPKGRLVYDTLRSKILSGEYGPGAKLRAATELAEEFKVAPMTVRHALARLEAEGLLTREYGRGTFIRARTPASVLVAATASSTRSTLRRAVSRMGYQVHDAQNASDALRALEAEPSIVLVLAEVRIPDVVDGVGFIRAVRRHWPNLPLVALTANSGDLDELYGKKEWPLLVMPEPFRARQVEEAVRLALRPSSAGTEPQRNRVLVVDDDAEVRSALRLVLESLSCDVDEASDSDEARTALKRHEFDHVFLDLRMPGGGVETARALAHDNPATTIVLATAYPQDLLSEDSGGLFTVLPKPFAIEAVEAALQLRRVPRSATR